jgi:hypothetical protein
MTAHACLDCLEPVPVRSRRQDARCDYCRTLVGRRRAKRQPNETIVRDLGPAEWSE